ncbi:hypothetical protein LCGC14_1299180 [marine sediment metagenome]|uniref:Uncharacterized protein n=1 Tax=marine sediment metagenome TaxID=412755 RepID=A0A0F9N6Q7_9ZZZZ
MEKRIINGRIGISFDNDFKADSFQSFYLLPYIVLLINWNYQSYDSTCLCIGWLGFRISLKFIKEK